jgi:MAF protein
MNTLILASASPRRKELLSKVFSIEIVPADIQEVPYEKETPSFFVQRMSREKAQQCAMKIKKESDQNPIIIAADTIVVLGDQILGKPKDDKSALTMLRLLNGQSHDVMTAYAIADQNGQILSSNMHQAKVQFKNNSDQTLIDYVDTKEPLDKAGAYGIQGLGANLIDSLNGSFFAVMGLDIIAICEDLLKLSLVENTQKTTLAIQYFKIMDQIKNAWFRSKLRQEVKLIAVSKYQSLEAMHMVYQFGQVDFGENYQQEWLDKMDKIQSDSALSSFKPIWHFIGQIQSNKAKKIGEFADFVHGVYKEEQIKKIAQGADLQKRKVGVLIQLNLSKEANKGGIAKEDLPQIIALVQSYPSLQLLGLMTFPPEGSAQESRPYFRELRELRDQYRTDQLPLSELSMGISHDFEVAIEEGASIVRVGSALFGARVKPN